MSRPPVVGATSYREIVDVPYQPQADIVYCPARHLDVLWGLGAQALVLGANHTDAARPDELLDHLDALLIVGGGDIDPARYDAQRHPRTTGIDPTRDEFELNLTLRAIDRELPVLGVCRGMQIINVALGGTLEQHLPDRSTQGAHHHDDMEPREHDITLEPNSHLGRAYGVAHCSVVSQHHQGLAHLANGLAPVAWAGDGTVEAIEAAEGFTVGIQWHPEASADRDPLQLAPYKALIRAATAPGPPDDNALASPTLGQNDP